MDFLTNSLRKSLLGMDISQIDSFIEGFSAQISSSVSGPNESAIILPFLDKILTQDEDLSNNSIWNTFQKASKEHFRSSESTVVMASIYRWMNYMLSRGNDYFGDADIQILQDKLGTLGHKIRSSLTNRENNNLKQRDIELIELLLEVREMLTNTDRFKKIIHSIADNAMRFLDSRLKK